MQTLLSESITCVSTHMSSTLITTNIFVAKLDHLFFFFVLVLGLSGYSAALHQQARSSAGEAYRRDGMGWPRDSEWEDGSISGAKEGMSARTGMT